MAGVIWPFLLPPSGSLRDGRGHAATLSSLPVWGPPDRRGYAVISVFPEAADAHPSVHKSVLESANPAWTRSVHVDAPGQQHGPQPVSGTADPGVVKQDKSSGGSVDTTKTRLDPRRVRMSSGEGPIGAAKGKPNAEALCQTPTPLPLLPGPAPPPPPPPGRPSGPLDSADQPGLVLLRRGFPCRWQALHAGLGVCPYAPRHGPVLAARAEHSIRPCPIVSRCVSAAGAKKQNAKGATYAISGASMGYGGPPTEADGRPGVGKPNLKWKKAQAKQAKVGLPFAIVWCPRSGVHRTHGACGIRMPSVFVL